MSIKSIFRTGVGVLIAAVLLPQSNVYGQGIYLSGVGPVNRSMAGAGTAAPLDAIGSLNWNPAAIGALPSSELAFGIELLTADIDLTSNIAPGTSGDAGYSAIPSIGWVHHMEGAPMTVGLGLYGVGGFKNNQPSGNALLGGGPAFAKADFLQLAPTVALELNDFVTVGFAPTVTIGEIGFDPLGPSVIVPGPMVSQGQGNRTHWGIGFQAGVLVKASENLNVGFSFKSPQWMETFEFFTAPSAAVPSGVARYKLDLPMILSLGFGYTGIPDWTLAADFRYFAYEDTDGFRELGWRNIFGASFGAQRELTESLAVRFGINFNENPIGAPAVFRNVVSPLIQRYNVSAGATYSLTECVDLNVAYVYLGQSKVTGPFTPVPGATLSNQISAHSAILGMTVRY